MLMMTGMALLAGANGAKAEFDRAVGVMAGQAAWDFRHADDFDGGSTAIRLFSQIKMADYWNLEAAIYSLGGINEQVNGGGDLSANGLGISVIRYLPLGPFSLRGKLGLNWTTTEYRQGGEASGDTDIGLLFGLGMQFDLHQHWGLRVEYERYNMGYGDLEIKVDVLTAGVVYGFY